MEKPGERVRQTAPHLEARKDESGFYPFGNPVLDSVQETSSQKDLRYRRRDRQVKKGFKMGLSDRDYMREKRRERPFSPPPERFNLGTLGMALVFVVALFFLYKVADWKLNHRAAQRASQPPAESALNSVPRPTHTPTQALPRQPADQNTPNATAGITQVTKCVVNGRTSYSDSSCPKGSISSQITMQANHNLIAAVRSKADSQTEAPAEQNIVEVQKTSFNDAGAKKSECQSLNAQIEHWDAMARQPQGAQTQDWIRAQRKKARDRQFQIHCQ